MYVAMGHMTFFLYSWTLVSLSMADNGGDFVGLLRGRDVAWRQASLLPGLFWICCGDRRSGVTHHALHHRSWKTQATPRSSLCGKSEGGRGKLHLVWLSTQNLRNFLVDFFATINNVPLCHVIFSFYCFHRSFLTIYYIYYPCNIYVISCMITYL